MAMAKEIQSPHVLLFPFPMQGHIKPYMNLAKVLSARGFYITFVNTEFVQKRLLESGFTVESLGMDNFRFETLPDGLPAEHGRTNNIPELFESVTNSGPFHFRKLMERLHNEHDDVPPLTFIVSDGILSYTQRVTDEFELPRVAFWTTSTCGLMCYFSMTMLMGKGYLPLKDESCFSNGYLEQVIECIPGLPALRLKELPSFCLVTDPSDFMFRFGISETDGTLPAAALILNTFEELEGPVLKALSAKLPVYGIGPLLLSQSLNTTANVKNYNVGEADELSLWKEESSCLKWLDTHNPASVLYVCFGSLTVLSQEQLLEFAWGLASSNQPFLWVMRPDLIHGESAILPSEFIEETKNRGMFVGWAPQIKVLSHPSVGGFLTHSGWNSTLESISEGVPMICWPFFAEQQTNAKFVSQEWKIGLQMKEKVERGDVAELVRKLMEPGEERNNIRRRIGEYKEKAVRAVKKGESSYNNLEKLLHQISLLQMQKTLHNQVKDV